MPHKQPFCSEQLHVLAVISNPMRFESRVRLYKEFEYRMLQHGVTLWTCEVAYGDRPFEATSPDNPQHLQLRTFHELWHKENMANLLLERLPQNWEYCALIDADVTFANPKWVTETIHMLQHHHVVQMWQDAIDLSPTGSVLERFESYMYRHVNRLPTNTKKTDAYNGFGHPGYAWAYRREAIEAMGSGMGGPFLDTAILGAADHHMCLALVGLAKNSLPNGINKAYRDEVYGWQERVKTLRQDVGYVNGTILHHWHGKKKQRKYRERWEILIENDYVPSLDLRRDWQGLYQLSDRSIKLRDDIRTYFRQRNEDSIDVV